MGGGRSHAAVAACHDFLASPVLARCLLTVRAAISLARFVERPCFCSLSLMCSYWRSRLLLQAFWGMRPSSLDSRDGSPSGEFCNYSSGSFWTLCSVAYSSVRLLITSAPSG